MEKRRIPMIIAHRGARREAPENTLPAFRRAIELGAEGIELDTLLTSDRVPVVTHNDDLSILTAFRGFVHATPCTTIRSLDVGRHFSQATEGVTMPTLAEALEFLARHDILTIVEIKAQPGMAASAAAAVGGAVSGLRMQGPLVISSASLRILRELRRRHPAIPRALIVRQRVFSFFGPSLFARFEGLSAIHASLSALTPGLVERTRRRGGEIHAWTVNTAEEMDRCRALEVDGIITDDVGLARRHFGEAFHTAGR